MQAHLLLQRELVDAAAARAGNDQRLAAQLGRSPQFISNLRHGQKKASVEVAADLASIAGASVPHVVLSTLIEAAQEPRRSRLQAALRDLGDWRKR